MNITLAKDTIDNKDVDALIEWLKTYPRLTKGNLTLEFEKKWSEYLGVKHSIFCNSGSSANLLMIYSLIETGRIKPGDNIVIPALSWSTSLAPAIQFGLNPILCDCNKENLSVDLDHLQKIINENEVSCLMVVPILGFVPDMDKISKICIDNDIDLIEDTCESLGSEYNGRKLGSFGLMSTFSTYFGHHISTIEGGMVCTNDDHLANILKSLRSHGWDRDVDKKYQKKLRAKHDVNEFSSLYTFYTPGFNLRATDLQAFLGINQLKKLDTIVKNRRKNFMLYHDLLDKSIWKPELNDTDLVSNFAYPIIHPNRKIIIKALNENNVENRPLLAGSLGQQPYWYTRYGRTFLPNADEIDKNGLYIPNHAELTTEEVEMVCNVINKCI